MSVAPPFPSTADAAPIDSVPLATGAAKDWPAFTAPGLPAVGAVQVKSAARDPDPFSCRLRPAASVPASATPISMLVRPDAGPLVAVMTPS